MRTGEVGVGGGAPVPPAVASRGWRFRWAQVTCGGLVALTAALLLAVGAAGAEPEAAPNAAPNALLQHYRAYREALEAGNLAAADTAAASALAASVAQYGDDGRTAVLAVNLAGVRLARREYAAAVEPARQAVAIAESKGAASGVDVRVARLLLGRAELPGGDAAATDRLMQAVKDAQGVAGIEAEAYPAAFELAVAAYNAGRYPLSTEAWVASVQFAEGAGVNLDYARAQAKLGEASARIMPIARRAPGWGRAILSEFEAIDALLAEAIDLVHVQAVQSEIGGELTRVQSVYGDATALKNALRAKLKSQSSRWKPTPLENQDPEIGVADDSPPHCARNVVAKPPPIYPPARFVVGGVGSVVLKVLVDEAGAVSRVQVAGTAGGPEFAKSVVDAARRWRVEKKDGAAPGCRMAGEFFIAVVFVFS